VNQLYIKFGILARVFKEIQGFRDSGILGLGDLGIEELGNLGIEELGNLGI